MNYIIEYYFDLQTIDNENIVDILKNMIDSNNISDEPLEYQLEILDNKNETLIFKGGEPNSTIPHRYFEEVADYLTDRKQEAEEERIRFLDFLFTPTKPTEKPEEVSNDTPESQPESVLSSSIVEETLPSVVEQPLPSPPPIIDEQIPTQQPPTIEQPLPTQPPMMNNQIYKGGNIKSSVITVRIIMQKNKALPFLFLKKMRYNLK